MTQRKKTLNVNSKLKMKKMKKNENLLTKNIEKLI